MFAGATAGAGTRITGLMLASTGAVLRLLDFDFGDEDAAAAGSGLMPIGCCP